MLLVEKSDQIAVVTLNRPEAMNAMSKAMRSELYRAMTALNEDDEVSVVILTGAGERAFTAGLDLKELGSDPKAMSAANAEGADENPVKAIETCKKPVIGIYRAKELSLTGNFLDAKTACEWGLVNRVVPAGELMAVARKLAADMATIPVETLSLYKRIIDEGFALPYGQSLAHEHAHSSAHNRTVTPEAVEARRAAIQARARTQ